MLRCGSVKKMKFQKKKWGVMIFTAIYNGHRVRILRYQHVGNNCHSLCETNRFLFFLFFLNGETKTARWGKSDETKRKKNIYIFTL